MRDYQRYPQDPETEENLRIIQAAQRTLRRYHRRFYCAQSNILLQLKGILYSLLKTLVLIFSH